MTHFNGDAEGEYPWARKAGERPVWQRGLVGAKRRISGRAGGVRGPAK
jgi:hypothetical protein